MESTHWLDEIARSLARATTRREALRRVGGALAGGLLAAIVPRQISAQAPCPGGQVSCNGACVNPLTDFQNCGACGKRCQPGQACSAGACTGPVICPPGQANCSEVCSDLQADRHNCGACGNVCPDGQACELGGCVESCSGGRTNCDGVCRDLQADRDNCGTCGNACQPGQACSAGACRSVR